MTPMSETPEQLPEQLNSPDEVVTGDELRLHDWVKRGSLYWDIQAITEFPKSRRLKLVRTGMPWETDVRRSTLVYRKSRS